VSSATTIERMGQVLGPLGLILLLLAALWGLGIWLRRRGAIWPGSRPMVRKIRIVDVVWFRPGSGCALIEIESRPFVVAIGDARLPQPLAMDVATGTAHEA